MSAAPAQALGQRGVVWVGGVPAHYTRVLHQRLAQRYPADLCFIYIQTAENRAQTAHERGTLPPAAATLEGWSAGFALLRILQRLRPRALILAGHYPRPVLLAGLWGIMRGVRLAYWSDTNLSDVLAGGLVKRLAKRVVLGAYLRCMHRLVYIGSRGRDFYLWACGARRVQARLRWAPYPHLQQICEAGADARDARATPFRVLYLGRLAAEKGVERLVRGFALLPADVGTGARLVIAGDGPERRALAALVQELDLGARTEFLGVVPSDQVPKVIRDAHVLVLPSYREPWGLVVNEAMSAKRPVIAPYWVGAAADLLIDGVTGVRLHSNEPPEICAALARLIRDPALTREMGETAQQVVARGQWSVDSTTAAFYALIAEALA